jgi:cytochrome d ubiquinol oxidase subunit I
MNEIIDLSSVDWSRGQFALTALYHWIFVPLTLGITFIIAIMETIYVKTGDEAWKKITKFWMKLFGINFAIGVATGIILEFEFGTNWSNYSWFVGDIFGAPLAIEGIFAFFMESTFIAIMFFGWGKVSKKSHLLSTWLTAVGANLSALWILIANAWMQMPVGMQFNPDTARNEMVNFWEIALSPMAVNKFLHTTSSGFLLASIFVIGISAWYLLKKREIAFAKKSILVAAVFGLFSSLYVVITGDDAAKQIAKVQPVKFAAMEGIYNGTEGVGLAFFGLAPLTNPELDKGGFENEFPKIEIPNLISLMVYYDLSRFIPGLTDLINGNKEHGIISAREKMERGLIAIETLKAYKDAKDDNSTEVHILRERFMSEDFQKNYFKYFGYGYIKDTDELIPNIALSFYSFHIMVLLGAWFILLCGLALFWVVKGKLENKRLFLWAALWSMPLVYLASMLGWVLAEVGRQPWVIQDLMPTVAAATKINAGSVQVTFWLFAIIFTLLLIAEIKIMTKQIKTGPESRSA